MTSYPKLVVSSGSQETAVIVFGAAAFIALLYCVSVARRERKGWPLYVFGGSMLLVAYEPINNFLGHCVYPTPSHFTMLTYLGQHVPFSTWFIYMFYFSVAVPFVMRRLEQGVSAFQLARYYVVAVLLCGAFEPVFASVHLGVRWWWYYGSNQALDFTGLPMFWWFANAMVVLVMAMIFHLLRKHVFTRDWHCIAFVPLAPLILIGVHLSAGTPYYIALTSTHGTFWSTIGAVGSIVISVFYMVIFGAAVVIRGRATAVHASTDAMPGADSAPTDPQLIPRTHEPLGV